MIQHLVSFPDEASAAQALAPFKLCTLDKDGLALWSGNVCLNHGGGRPGKSRVVLEKAEWGPKAEAQPIDAKAEPADPKAESTAISSDMVLVKPEVLEAGWQCVIADEAFREELVKVTGNALRVVWDGIRGDVLFKAGDLAPDYMTTVKVEPIFLGSSTPFSG